MKFREALPTACPPNHAVETAQPSAFRLISSANPQSSDFDSNAASKPAPLGCDPCRWASCSLYTNLETLKMKRETFPKLRKMAFYAKLSISENCGKSVVENNHIDFWMSDKFDPVKSVVAVAQL